MLRKRVVITGMGALTPVGNSVEESWKNICAGRSGIALLDDLDEKIFPSRIGGRIKHFDPLQIISKKEVRRTDVFVQYGLYAAMEAVDNAGLQVSEKEASRYGVAIGSGIGGITSIEENHTLLKEQNSRRISPFFIPGAIINMAAGWVSMKCNFQGPNFATSTACASGSHAIALAAQMILCDDADVMIAGGAEKASSFLGMSGFSAARALSTHNNSPEQASRPWDRDRDGFVMGDGAGMLVLEERQHAIDRGAFIYAELSGYGMSSDAWHMTAPPENGRGAAIAMQAALDKAGLLPEMVSYINAHGTSTPVGDLAETRAVHQVFGSHAKRVPISSTKSMTGHLLGAAGAIESVFSVKSLMDQMAPGTINLEHPGNGCDLDYMAEGSRSFSIKHVLSNSFGFGGTNVSLLFSRVDA